MKNLFIFLLAVGIVSCSSVRTSYDIDKSVDFTKYKTYGYSEDALKLPVQELNRNRVFNAVDRELAARGLTKSDNPDLLIDLHARAEQKTEATATTTGTGAGMYGRYGGPWRYGYGGGFTTTTVDYNNYVEGTLFVNVVDKAQDKIVWQGRGTKTLDETASPQKRESNINNGIKAIFAQYPVKPKK
jgi:hypothetical protein